ncbi:MAG TPA: NAD(P)H-dependent oxidoreductase [Candidatus Anaerostipes excrementavium]|uniref:NAD(P)H-dependent oxidoreductase n=1 Tax=Candidatus Anaerostipes excrementavium TaxID=2838463 RepID=A0A9D1WZY0_9FIRM|nr:flavodoxin [uncultured Anaerostipes sp.]HIX69065.1 NAD(P)H-dependent oxidoreductase [Candidatus Anaerostipes excrementavium]
MRRVFIVFLSLILVCSIAGCRNSEERKEQTSSSKSTAQKKNDSKTSADRQGNGKVLVAYFSWADNVKPDEDVDAVTSPSVTSPGNVQELAGWVQEETEGDLFSIRVKDPYPGNWDDCLERANEERGKDARPALEDRVENLDEYDVVFLGFPNWWYGVPMPLLSFLEENDLSGKQVYLFCSHGTGGLADSVNIITEALPDAEISEDVFDCYEEDAGSSEGEIKDWVSETGYGK